MGSAIVAMVVVIIAALAVAALVVMGMEGRYTQRAPELSHQLARAARHLNGDGRVPRRLERLFR